MEPYANRGKIDLKGVLKRDAKALDDLMFWVANHVHTFGRVLIEGPDNTPYLLRVYLTPKRSGDSWWPGVFLHRFFRSDADRWPHNHPWCDSMSLILTNGYLENRWDFKLKAFRKIMRKPFRLNFIKANDFHRVDLVDTENGCWTLFIAFQRSQNWGFLNLETGEVIPHQDYLPAGADGLAND